VNGILVDPTYGDEEMAFLIRMFGFTTTQDGGVTSTALIDPIDAQIKWQTCKQVLAQLNSDGCSLDEGYKPIFMDESSYGNMRILAAIFMCLCLATVCCEKGFSLMTNIMTALRNCMNIITLDCLMKNSSNCPKFDHMSASLDPLLFEICEKAYAHWVAILQRFPGRAHGKQGCKKKGSAGTLSDYYEELFKTTKASGGGARLLESSDEEEEEDFR